MARTMNAARALFLGSVALFTVACGADSAIVGGSCKPGYVEAAGSCVVSKTGSLPPVASSDTPKPGRPAVTKSETSGSREPPTGDPIEPPVTELPPLAPPPLDVPITVPPPPFAPPSTPNDTPPELVCAPPLIACRGVCISVESDPLNCGACGRICPSNICVARECVGATPGDIVVIGHEMADALQGSAHAKVLTNAVTIPTTDPIRVLSYEAGADLTTSASVRALLGASITSRKITFTTASPEALESTSLYAQYDVVLVHGAAGANPVTLGARWASPLQTFTSKGGVFVAIDGGSSDMPALVSATGLLSIGAHVALASSTRFAVTGAADVVGAQVLSPFAAFGASVAFTGVEAQSADVTWVVRTDDVASLPTVVHKIAR